MARLGELKRELLLMQGEFNQLHELQKYSSTKTEE